MIKIPFLCRKPQPDHQTLLPEVQDLLIMQISPSNIQESGAILRGARRMQINMFLTRMNNLRALTNVTEGLFPILWIDEVS
jgi:hypothetical protein